MDRVSSPAGGATATNKLSFTGGSGFRLDDKPEISSALKGLKENYEQLESQIVENTKRQRQDQIDKHKEVLTQLEALRQFLKIEVANRKETELHFERQIEKTTASIAEQFNITYLNGLFEMRDRIKSFHERKAKMEVRNRELKDYIERELGTQKQEVLSKIKTSQ